MAKRSLILTSTSNQGKKLQKTFTDVNPAATSESMLTAVQMINDFTTATYVQTDCVDKFNLDTEDVPSKTEPTLSVTNVSGTDGITLEFLNNYTSSGGIRCRPITYNGDGQLYAYTLEQGVVVGIVTQNRQQTETGIYLCFRPGWAETRPKTFPSFPIYIVATEGENYAAKTIELVVE